jgi:diketogulonate reductase-like aldo/keto reductase
VYKSRKGAETYEAVRAALRIGYRHVDTAEWYRNELDVGRAVRDSGLPRADVFLTTKLWVSHWGYDQARAGVQASNERLGASYIDLLLLHAPGDATTRAETWRALEDLRQEGVVRDIGVSNFSAAHLEKLMETARVPPAVNQIELHPWLARKELVEFCRSHGILVEAYSPLAKATRLDDPVLVQIAEEVEMTPAQVLVAYALAKGYIAIPKSVSAERLQENWDAAEHLELPPAAVGRLDALDAGIITAWDPMTTHAV